MKNRLQQLQNIMHDNGLSALLISLISKEESSNVAYEAIKLLNLLLTESDTYVKTFFNEKLKNIGVRKAFRKYEIQGEQLLVFWVFKAFIDKSGKLNNYGCGRKK